jgi:hypothetical protein
MKSVQSKFVVNLKRRVVLQCGFDIRSKKDCKRLSDAIKYELNEVLSEATIYRFFLGKESEHSFYESTYSIFAQFVGFKSWGDFCGHVLRDEETSGRGAEHTFDLADPSLLDYVVKRRAWEILDDYIEGLNAASRSEGLQAFGWNIYLALMRNPSCEMEFYERFSAGPIVRQAFFEFAADPDEVLPNYRAGFQLYIKTIAQQPAKNQLRDHVFAHSLMVRSDYIHGDFSKVIWRFEKYLEALETRAFKEVKEIIPLARLVQAKWLFLHAQEEQRSVVNHKKWILAWVSQVWPKANIVERKAILYCMAEAFDFTADESNFIKQLCAKCEDFLGAYFLSSAEVTPKLLLSRMEFNGLKLQRRSRE